ncbi:2-oxoisovalerate dehydrogenase E2 component (dihydrolipoyl transacylase) [Evansella vedderi]|uniref:Dihydrolipoamide acetyltransferase component of pyruvate dehydrogenase complex n=1 Tax=Evansella vedderi TaxID=38282 RepID=A0ABT9ZZP4_9BACI|nr:dihydrolipoamide acetyltransferase family protein [Evansella vedderi]MDQ0256227.1 2-oxoisovalerate dehydrogenase E2 component (dihydrolipoyl transacylase) [Evansella vedderi]
MATKITMPQLGESVTEGTITKWLVKPGDQVNKYDPIAEVMTDKVNAEIPSSYTGTIKELIAGEDETIAVGEVICTITVEGEAEEEVTVETLQEEVVGTQEQVPADTSNKKRYSPAVLKLAQEHDINLEQVNGSGRGGRITRKDLLTLIESGGVPKGAPMTEPVKEVRTPGKAAVSDRVETKQAPTPPYTTSGRVEELPISGVRKAIANNMVRSKHEAPHAWMMIEVDVTDLVRYRNKMKDEFYKKEDIKLTFLPFFIKATVDALKEYPQVNSMWAGDKIIRHKDVHISLAVATENELFVPVIKHADEKTVKGLAREINDLATKVRTNQLKSEDMQGGTFTVNNTGSFGSIQSQPIINYPQAAILSVESIVKRPVVLENDAIAVRHMVNLCMSLDHRILDGLVCGKFLGHIKNSLESMNEKNTSIY